MLLGERFDLALDIEPMLRADLRAVTDGRADQDEGELTAAKRLLPRVKKSFGWLEVVVADGLYANGPFLTLAEQLRMGAVVIARKEGDEPLREARRIWSGQKPQQIIEDPQSGERVELWDCPALRTLDSYKGPIRMVLGRVSNLDNPPGPPRDWCMAVTGRAVRLSPRKVLAGANRSTGCGQMSMSPQEPSTLYATTWDFRRQPWTFRSGGPGSGIFKSTDGGDHWNEITESNAKGLPAKPYATGRIGSIGLATE